MEDVKTIAFKRFDGGEVRAHLYLPENPRSLMPVYFYFHGGGWEKGSPAEAVRFLPGVAQGLFKRGTAVISVEYRLAPPADSIERCVEDCADAVRFFTRHAGEYGFDEGRMFAGGASAGGQLALMTALAMDCFSGAEELKGVKYSLRCVINLFGPTDLMIIARAALDSDPERARTSLKRLVGDCGNGLYEMSRLSPCSYVKCGALPPVLTVHGELDEIIAKEHHTELVRLYDAAGGGIEFVEVKHVGHVFKIIEGQPAPEPDMEGLAKIILEFVDRNIK